MKTLNRLKQNFSTFSSRIDWLQLAINVYTFLFIFTMFNKEFLLFGLDLRFLQLPLGLLIVSVSLIAKRYKKTSQRHDSVGKALIVFYAFAFISNLAWLWNDLTLYEGKFINEIILLANIVLGLLVFYLNKILINQKIISIGTIISCCILTISIFLVHQGFSLEQISGSGDVTYIYKSSQGISHINAFGENFRCAGYASDPNYATMLLLIGIVCVLLSKQHKIVKVLLVAVFTLAIGLSFSKTIILAIILCAIYVLSCQYFKVSTIKKLMINRIFIIGIIAITLIIPFLASITKIVPLTLNTRFVMWRTASEVFTSNPIIGGGITSFRSAFAIDHWYVQAHSTYWQILAELGIIGIFLYYRAIIKSLNQSTKSPLNYFITLVFIIWIFTCETIALPFGIFVYYLILTKNRERTKKSALFMVNSLRQGGAEKVCLSLADELKRQKFFVDFIILKDQKNIPKNKNTKVFSLNANANNKLIRALRIIFTIPRANDIIMSRQIENGEYNLVTSHLPVSNIITRLSCMNRQAIYVLHLSMDTYKFMSQKLFIFLTYSFFWHRKVVSVSNGLRDELITKYHFQQDYTQTIYNPINIKSVTQQIQKKRPMKEKYFLHVGRFEQDKRQDRMVEVFHQGKFKKDYHLVFCGTGSGMKTVQNTVNKLGITDKVHFMGYQDNIYTWMKHATVLVSTSDREAFPMNLVEALACNTKVIASDCEFGPREILLDDYAQFLVRPVNDIDQYITNINLSIKHYPKTKKRILTELQPSKIIQEYLDFYRR